MSSGIDSSHRKLAFLEGETGGLPRFKTEILGAWWAKTPAGLFLYLVRIEIGQRRKLDRSELLKRQVENMG